MRWLGVSTLQDDVDSLLESLQASRANARQDLDMEGTRRPERLPSFAQTDVDLFINSLAGSKKGAEGPKVQGDTASVHVLVRAGLSPVGEDTIDSARDDLAPCSVGYVSQLGPRVSVKSLETEELWTLSKERPQSGPPLSPEVFEMPLNLDGLSLTSESPGPLWLPGPSPHVEQSLDLRPPCAPPAAVANLSGTSSGSPKQRCGWVAGWSLSVVLLIASAGAVILAAWALCPDAASSFYRNLGVPVPVAMPNGHARIPQGDISSTALSAFPSQEPESQFFLAEELVHPVGQDSFVDGTFCLDHDVDFSPTGPAPFDAVAMDQCEPFELLLRHWCNWGSETIYLQEESSNTDKELQILTAVDPLGSQGLDLTLTAVDPLGLDLILPDWNGMEGLARGILAEGYEDSNRDSAGGSDGHAAQLQDLVAELDNLVVAGSSPDFERFGDEEVDKYRSGLPLREEPMAEVDGFVAATESRRPSNFDEDEEVPEPSTGWPLDFQDLLAELDGLIVEGKFLNKLEPVITAEDIGDAEDTDTQRRPSAGPKPEVPNNSTASGSSSFLAKIAGALPPGVARSGMQTINWALHCGAAGVIANAIRGAISRRVHRGFGRPSRIF